MEVNNPIHSTVGVANSVPPERYERVKFTGMCLISEAELGPCGPNRHMSVGQISGTHYTKPDKLAVTVVRK